MNNALSPILALFQSRPIKNWIECEGIPITGREILKQISEAQQLLSKHGVRPLDHVIVFSGRGNQFWIDVMALWGIGAVAVPLDPETTLGGMANVLRKAEPIAFIGKTQLVDLDIPEIRRALLANGASDAPPQCLSLEVGALASILFTSGSTGEPKGVMLTHEAIHGNAIATKSVFELDNITKLVAPIPFRFVSSLSHFVATLYSGVSYSGIEKKLLKTELLSMLEITQADAFGGSPLQVRWIAELASSYKLNLKWIMSSGDNLPKQIIEDLTKGIRKIKIVTAYGLTEVGGRFCILPPSRATGLAGSVGKPIPGLSVKIRDESFVLLPNQSEGQVFVSGDFLFAGYINDPEKTSACLSELGFATGDVGRLDLEGNLYLSGRTDDVFKSGGLKVSTLPIAAALMASGVFEDLAVVPEKDEVLNLVPVVYFKLKKDQILNKGSHMRALRGSLMPEYLPRKFVPIDYIPRTGSGKIQRGELAKLIATLKAAP